MASDTFIKRMTVDENEAITRVGPGTRMGKVMRRYWQPVLHSWEPPEPCVIIARVSGSDRSELFCATQRTTSLI